MIGFTNRIGDLLSAVDLLVSPVRYEPYGLNVQEAICYGVPAIVSKCAGVAERYPIELRELLLPDPENSEDLAVRIRNWKSGMVDYKNRTEQLAAVLRDYTWKDMAQRIVSAVEQH